MSSKLSIIIFVYFLFHSGSQWSTVLTQEDNDHVNLPLLLVVAYDGLRYDFVNKITTPNLWRLARKGVWAPKGMKNQMVTLTAPSFQTIVTGLYQEKHGIIGNTFYDPEFDEHYDYWDHENETVHQMALHSKWYQAGEPIWQTNDRHENGRKSGAMRWPLCDAAMNNITMKYCTGWEDFGNVTVWKRDLDKLLDWFDRENDPINLGLFYVSEPDHTEHENDIYSVEVRRKIAEIDVLTGYLEKRLREKNLLDKMNIIFTSDHGHVNVFTRHNALKMDDYIDPSQYIWSSKSLFLSKTSQYTVEELYAKFDEIRMAQPKFQIWLKEDFPDKFHYKNNRRIGPIIFLEQMGYVVVSHLDDKGTLPPQANLELWGNHGYSNEYDEMRPFFAAVGPVFEAGLIMETEFENVDLYNLMCHVLKIDPAVNDGNFDRVWAMLKHNNSKSSLSAFVSHDDGLNSGSLTIRFRINNLCFLFILSVIHFRLLF